MTVSATPPPQPQFSKVLLLETFLCNTYKKGKKLPQELTASALYHRHSGPQPSYKGHNHLDPNFPKQHEDHMLLLHETPTKPILHKQNKKT
jgi:hypothetical protein